MKYRLLLMVTIGGFAVACSSGNRHLARQPYQYQSYCEFRPGVVVSCPVNYRAIPLGGGHYNYVFEENAYRARYEAAKPKHPEVPGWGTVRGESSVTGGARILSWPPPNWGVNKSFSRKGASDFAN